MKRSGWQLTGVIWFAASLILLTTRFHVDQASHYLLAEGPRNPVLSPDAWQTPLNRWLVIHDWFCVSGMTAALVCALITVSVTAAVSSAWLRSLTVCCLSLLLWPMQGVTVLLIYLAGRIAAKVLLDGVRPSWQTSVWSLLICGLALVVSVDFGLVIQLVWSAHLAQLICRWSRDSRQHRIVGLLVAGVVPAITLAIVSQWADGFWSAFLLPELMIAEHVTGLPSLPWPEPFELLAYVCLLWVSISTLFAARSVAHLNSSTRVLFAAGCLCCIALGILVPTLLLPALVTLFALSGATSRNSVASAAHSQNMARPIGVCLIAVIAFAGWQLRSTGGIGEFLSPRERQVALTDWQFEGSVLLPDLSLADAWRSRPDTTAWPLLLDNGFDHSSSIRRYFHEQCEDLRAGRKESYRRADGGIGGYSQLLQSTLPALIVLSSEDTRGIRALVADPDWSLAAVDGRWTIFAQPDDGRTSLQVRRAGAAMFYLEWPKPGQRIDLARTLNLGLEQDSRQIASVLNAIRLPYAALRVLPKDDSRETRLRRLWSYTELAIRCRRQSGELSLIDVLRAHAEVRALQDMSLGKPDRALMVQRVNSLAAADQDMSTLPQADEQLQMVRQAIAKGDFDALSALMKDLKSQPDHSFAMAVRTAVRSSDRALKDFRKISEDPATPPELKSEILFYEGCLQLESGNAQKAVSTFRECLSVHPATNFRALLQLYLAQMGGLAG